jgi:outer membrane protein TolC
MFSPRGLLRAVAGAALVMSLAGPALAQAGSILTLPEALARAEAQAPALAEAKAAVDAARGRTQQAGVIPNPEARARLRLKW